MQVTDVKRQKRRPDRVSVFLDGEFWAGMSELLWREKDLVRGTELSESQKAQIEEEIVSESALAYALDRISERMLPEAKLRGKLAGRELGPDVIEATIRRLKEMKLVDDAEWARAVTSERIERGQGRRKIEQFLRQSGIDEELRKEALGRAFDELDEEELAAKALDSRFEEPLDFSERRRAQNFLLRRGFSSQAARAVVQARAMSKAEEAEAMGPERALEDLTRRYGGGKIDPKRATGYLARRGYSFEVIKKALSESAQ